MNWLPLSRLLLRAKAALNKTPDSEGCALRAPRSCHNVILPPFLLDAAIGTGTLGATQHAFHWRGRGGSLL